MAASNATADRALAMLLSALGWGSAPMATRCMMGSVLTPALQSMSRSPSQEGHWSLRSRRRAGRFGRSSFDLTVCLSSDLLSQGPREPGIAQRLVDLPGDPEVVQQHGKLPGYRYHRPLLGVLAAALRDLQAVPAEVGAIAQGPRMYWAPLTNMPLRGRLVSSCGGT